MARKIRLGATDADIIRAVHANAERCKPSKYIHEPVANSIACRKIGLDVSFAIRDRKAEGVEVQEEINKGFRKCQKLYERDDHSREGELISCVAGMDSIVHAFGYKTVWDREAKTWRAVPASGNGNGLGGKRKRRSR